MTASLSGLRRRPILIALAAIIFVLLAPLQARAAFQITAVASTTASTATLAAPATISVTADNSTCGIIIFVQPTMKLTWSVTTSIYATGYVITPVLNGTPQTAVSISGRATTTWTVNVVRNGLLTPNTYQFRIQAVYSNWTSAPVTTGSANCPFL
ncbi:hypothetical protein [Kineosporia sp. NBRC 101731]|uniref:hypothetical protein n=1 Tax=Kineosporia sp. NBRC 101731 TaxID=3032199 RepID=UPI0024A32D44|nr:hypothetical protein [Kineosporia sp. NBRC 101731]GLY27454.1 hypothetical protein Kisp02_08190 [Kineosporia sp. NBRC 101731]